MTLINEQFRWILTGGSRDGHVSPDAALASRRLRFR